MKGTGIVFLFLFGLILSICLAKQTESSEEISDRNTPTPKEDSSVETGSDSEEENNIDKEGEKKGGKTKVKFLPVPLPTDFRVYDVLYKDGFISLEELVNVTEAKENVELAFSASDKNGDGLLSEEEFNTAPWMLQGDPSLNDEEVKVLEQEFHNQPPTPPALKLQPEKSSPTKTPS
jgi:Ca2+-binding EF-hand superfamily protein/Na+-transporting methylmalonyl-CoA/oxaloacetate decarboxylase gamma subunit